MTRGQQANPGRQWSVIFIAVFAMLIVQTFRLSNHWTIWGVLFENVLTLAVICSLPRYLRRLETHSTRHELAYSLCLLGLGLTPILTQFTIRPFDIGDPNELVLLNIVQNIAVALALVPYSRKGFQISTLLSGFLVFFVTSMTDSRVIWVLSALFGVVGLWSLMCSYWGRLESKFITSSHRILPLRPMAISLALLILVGVITFASVGVPGTMTVLHGFMPTSGGDKSQDRFARSGVGNGDMMIAAEDSAYTFGPVDSQIFLESTMPSLYDVASDRYGEAKIKKKVNKEFNPAISITADRLRHNHQKKSQSEQASRQFSTMRRFSKQRAARPDDRLSNALFQVAGPTPLHLVTERFDSFDGLEWSHSGHVSHPATTSLQSIEGKPWLQVKRDGGSILKGKQSHTLRIINLKSKRIPSPSHLAGIHIADVNRENFYSKTDDGVFQLATLEHIPRLTVIHLVSQVYSHDSLIARGDFRRRDSPSLNSRATQTSAGVQLDELASQWTKHLQPGWNQVTAVVETLRNEFTHDRRATAPDGCKNIVEHFLRTRRGPDYMFASTAAEVLRAIGYESQVVMGFYADPANYDARSQQTSVGTDALHFWTEVHVGQGVWIPLEPTPGYRPPQSWISWQQRVAMALVAAGQWILEQWHLVVLLICGGVALLLVRHTLFDLGSLLLWRAGWFGSTRRRIIWTVRILEFRARMAGQRRPRQTTLPKWYLSLCGNNPALNPHLGRLKTVLALADRAMYTPRGSGDTDTVTGSANMYQACFRFLAAWTSRRMKRSGTRAK